MKTPSCANCRFFLPDDFGNDTCRRHAPTTIFDGRTLGTVWPVVTSAHWCGDHQLPDLPPPLPPLPASKTPPNHPLDGGEGQVS